MTDRDNRPAPLKTWQRIFYGMGNMGGNFLNMVFMMWVFKLYCPPEGEGMVLVPALWLGAALFVGRIVDAVADPLIGYWSDNAHTRWGRRIPFMLFGGLPMCLVFFLIWAPPTGIFTTQLSLFVYLCVLMGAFWFLFTAVLCPYLALLPEIAVTVSERVNLSAYMSAFLLGSSGLIMVISPVVKEKFGFVVLGALFTVLGLISVYAPVVAVRERRDRPPPDPADKYGLFTALKWSFQNRPFVIYLVSSVFAKMGFNTIIASLSYIVTVILRKPDSFTAVILMGAGAIAVISFIFMGRITKRLDKKDVYKYGMLAMALLLPMIFVFGQYDVSLSLRFIGIDTVIPELYVAFAIFTLTGFPISALLALPPPILSDVIDLDELRTGKRREAMYFGAQGLLEKAGIGLSGLIMGVLFHYFGASKANHLGIDLLGPVTAVFVFIGFLIFLWYPLDQKESEKIRQQLEERRAGGQDAT